MKRILYVLLVFVMILGVGIATVSAEKEIPDVIKIGMISTISGEQALDGQND